MSRRIVFLYGALCYVAALATFLYLAGFLGNFGVPNPIDGPRTGSFWTALLLDLALLGSRAPMHHRLPCRLLAPAVVGVPEHTSPTGFAARRAHPAAQNPCSFRQRACRSVSWWSLTAMRTWTGWGLRATMTPPQVHGSDLGVVPSQAR